MVVFYRRMPRFGYARPGTLAEALTMLAGDRPVKHQVYAGGTDLLPKLRRREVEAPARLIDLKGITSLDHIAWDPKEGLRIGALTTISAVAASPIIRQRFAALAQAAREMASDQIQNRATLAGNICNALPSADSAPPLLVHRGRVVCTNLDGERSVDVASFFHAPGETALQAGELVEEIRLPPADPSERSVYLKLAPRGRMDLATVGAAVSVVVEGGLVRDVRIGLGSAGPVPVRALEAEAALRGQKLTSEVIENAARIAAKASRTRSSHRASADYRRLMLEVLTRRAVAQLAIPSERGSG